MVNLLGHRNIKNKELPLLAKAINDDLQNKKETLKQLSLIDDLLDIRKMELLLTVPEYTKSGMLKRKKRKKLNDFIEERINQDLF